MKKAIEMQNIKVTSIDMIKHTINLSIDIRWNEVSIDTGPIKMQQYPEEVTENIERVCDARVHKMLRYLVDEGFISNDIPLHANIKVCITA